MPDKPETPEHPRLAEAAAVTAETSHAPANLKEHDRMLDVHVPHPTHTWKDFFIHVGTICVGLLIAVSLEQMVEYFHHRHQAERAREMLATEMADNDRTQQRIRYILNMHEDYLFKDLAVIDRLRRHALQPTDRIVLFHINPEFADSAWQTAQQSGAIELFSYSETQRYAHVYSIQADFNVTQLDSMNALQNANTMFYASAADRFDKDRAAKMAGNKAFSGELGEAAAHLAFEDQARTPEQLQRLTPQQVDRLEQTIQQAIYQDEKLLNRCTWLTQAYHQFIKQEETTPGAPS